MRILRSISMLMLLAALPRFIHAQQLHAPVASQTRVNVTSYGARGDGSDDTAAIQAAIDAACSAGSGGGGIVYFPRPSTGGNGYYRVLQKQLPFTGAIFDLRKCRGGITLEGDASVNGANLQFARNPMTRIVAAPGSNPSRGAVFFWSGDGPGPTFRNLSIRGWNRAIELQNGNNVTFDNVALTAQNTQQGWGCKGGSPNADCGDNVPLAIYNSIWIYADQLALIAPQAYGYSVGGARREDEIVTLQTQPQSPVLGVGTKINLRGCTAAHATDFDGGPFTVTASSSNSIQFRQEGAEGAACTGGRVTSVEYSLLASGIPATDHSTPGVSLLRIDKSIFGGGGILFDQREYLSGGTGSFYLYNVDQEGNSESPFLTVTASESGHIGIFGPLHIVDSQAFDCSGQPFIRLGANPSAQFQPIEIMNSSGCTNRGKAMIELQSGQLGEVSIEGAADAGIGRFPADAAGKIQRSISRNETGFDFVVNTADAMRLRTDIAARAGFGNSGNGAAIRMAASGNEQASLALDPSSADGGLLFGDGIEKGYDARISHPDPLSADISFAAALPPAEIQAVPATGGALIPGSYFVEVSAYTKHGGMRISTPSAEASVALSQGENAIRVAWKKSAGLQVDGYIVYVCTFPAGCEAGGAATQFRVEAASGDSFVVTTLSGSHGSAPAWNTTLMPAASFRGRKFGVNNASPQAQIDIVQQDSATTGFNLRAAKNARANPWQIADANSLVCAAIDANYDFSIAGHRNQMTADGDSAGILNVHGGSEATKRFATPFHFAPVCTASPRSNPGRVAYWVTTTPASFAIHLSGPATLDFQYVCAGNPN